MHITPLPYIKLVVPVVTTERLNATMFAPVVGPWKVNGER